MRPTPSARPIGVAKPTPDAPADPAARGRSLAAQPRSPSAPATATRVLILIVAEQAIWKSTCSVAGTQARCPVPVEQANHEGFRTEHCSRRRRAPVDGRNGKRGEERRGEERGEVFLPRMRAVYPRAGPRASGHQVIRNSMPCAGGAPARQSRPPRPIVDMPANGITAPRRPNAGSP